MKKTTKLLALLLMFIGFGVANAATVTYNVPEGAVIEEFDGKFTISVADANEVTIGQYMYVNLYRVNGENNVSQLGYAAPIYDAETKVITCTFDAYYFWPDFPMQTNGNYYIDIQAGTYTVDGTTNEATKVNFTIQAPEKFLTQEEVTIDPATATFEDVIPQFVITLPEDVTSVDFNEVAAGNAAYYGTITAQAQFGSLWNGNLNNTVGEYNITVDGNKLILTPAETLTFSDLRQGEWGLRILRNSMYFNGDPTKTNEMMVFGPYVFPQFMSLEFSPLSGSTIVDASKFVAEITSGQTNVVVDETIAPELHYFDAEAGAYVFSQNLAAAVVMGQNNWGGTVVKVEMTPTSTEPLAYGKYKIVMPKGALKTTDDEPVLSAPASAEYEYIAMPTIDRTPTWTIEEGATLTMFTDVTMTFPEASRVDYVGRYNYDIPITINKVEGDVVTPLGYNGQLDVTVNGNSVRLAMNEYYFSGMVPLDIDGEYRIIVPAGNFSFEGVDAFTNEEQVLNFKIDAPDPVITQACASIDPAPSVVNHLANTYTITLDGIEGVITVAEVTENVFDQEYGGYVPVTGPASAQLVLNGSYSSYTFGKYNIAVDGNKLILTPGENISEDAYWEYGDYDIVIPKGVLIVDGDPTKTNDRISFGKYTIEHLEKLSFSEPQAAVVDKLSSFVVASNVYSTPAQIDNTLISIAKYDSATEAYVVLDNAITATASINADYVCEFALTLASEITEAGKYKVTVGRGAFTWEDYRETYVNATLEGEFEIEATLEPEVAFAPVSVDPVEGNVASLNKITLTFDAQYFPQGLWVEDNSVVNVYNVEAPETVVATAALSADNSQAKVYIDFAEEFLADGTFKLVIASGLISDYNNAEFVNPEIALTYTMEVSGINEVEQAAGNVNVVSINGIVVKQNASEADVKALAPGLYIVNGKKVVIRK